jgi:hypothetical protein
MKVFTSVAASALVLPVVIANPVMFRGEAHRRLATDPITYPSGLTKVTNTDAFHMAPVRAIHARVQGDAPEWNADKQIFISSYGSDFDSKFRASLDTVNTASVEGALMYVQAEGIDVRTASETCKRKNSMKYVVFYDIVFAQTNETLATYPDAEYGPMLPMDSGQCTPTATTPNVTYPEACYMINGDSSKPVIGPFVGAGDKSTEARAPYPNTVWYSFPNTCPLEKWSTKTDTCRAATRRGLCAYDTMPDGVTCTYNYRILGYVALDDLVGITAMDNKAKSAKYADFAAFCADGGIEYETNTDGTLKSSIDFWATPFDKDANSARATKLVKAFTDLQTKTTTSTIITETVVANFKALPTVASLTEANPPCYKSVKACATAEFGCKRTLYSQLCTKCTADGETGCVKKPSDFTYPTLSAATPIPTPAPSTASTMSTLAIASAAMSLVLSVFLM